MEVVVSGNVVDVDRYCRGSVVEAHNLKTSQCHSFSSAQFHVHLDLRLGVSFGIPTRFS